MKSKDNCGYFLNNSIFILLSYSVTHSIHDCNDELQNDQSSMERFLYVTVIGKLFNGLPKPSRRNVLH